MLMKSTAASGGDLEYKFIKFAPTALDPKTGMFAGYASVFGNEDLGGDVVKSGAFRASLQERPPQQVKMLYEHDPLQPIGVWTRLAEDDRGLMAEGKLLLPDASGRGGLKKAEEVHTLMTHGVLDGLSIGYRVRKSSPDRGNRIRVLEDIELREISAVMFPMNELSVISSVKSDLPTEREFQRLLQRDAGLSRSEAEHVIAHGLKSLLKTKRELVGEVASKQPDVDWSAITGELRRLNDAARS